jgi:hypothetical protein
MFVWRQVSMNTVAVHGDVQHIHTSLSIWS